MVHASCRGDGERLRHVERTRIVLETFGSWEVCSAAAEVASVLSQLRHAKPGRGHHVHQVQLQLERRSRAKVQGHDADDEPTGCARRGSWSWRWSWRSSASGSAGSGSASWRSRRSCRSGIRRAAASGRSAEQAQGHDGRRRTAEYGLCAEAAGSARCTSADGGSSTARSASWHSDDGRVPPAGWSTRRASAGGGAAATIVRTAGRQPARWHDGRG